MTNTCKAVRPNECRFHGHAGYARLGEYIADCRTRANRSETLNDKEYWEKRVSKLEVERDASAVGFKKLSKELRKAVRNGTVEKQAELAARIKKAASLRLLDGWRSDWEESTKNPHVFADKIIELSKTNDTVKIPVTLAGTQAMGMVAAKIQKEGNEVTELEVRHYGKEGPLDPKEMAFIKANALKHLQNGGGNTMWEHLDKNHCALRGLKFKDSTGREVTVVTDINIDEKERDLHGNAF